MDDPTVSVAAFGGSMHLADPAHNFVGTSGIVGQSIAHAAGAALTARLLPSISIPYSSQLKRPDASCWSTRAPRHGSVAALIAAEVAEKGFHSLKAPIRLVTTLDAPIPYSEPLENYVLPDEDKIVKAVMSVLK